MSNNESSADIQMLEQIQTKDINTIAQISETNEPLLTPQNQSTSFINNNGKKRKPNIITVSDKPNNNKPNMNFSKNKKKKLEYNLDTHNPYDSLSSDDEDDDQQEMQTKNKNKKRLINQTASTSTNAHITNQTVSTSNTVTITKTNRMPPIIINGIDSITIQKCLSNEILKHNNYTIQIINKNSMRLMTQSLEDYNKAKMLFQTNSNELKNINGYTYTPKDIKPINVVLKGLPYALTNEEILSNIKELNNTKFEVKTINYLRSSSHRIVQLTAQSDIKEILKIKYLYNHKIYWDKLNANSPSTIQCKKCQRFGHVSINCFYTQRCVKCTTQHEAGNCPRNSLLEQAKQNPDANGNILLDDNVACVNCNQKGHPANYRECPVYLKYIEIKNKQSNNRQTATINTAAYASGIQKNLSYSSVVTGNQQIHSQHSKSNENNITHNNNNQSSNNLSFIQNECQNLFNLDLFTILDKINNFIPNYQKLTNTNDKKKSFIAFLFELSTNNVDP